MSRPSPRLRTPALLLALSAASVAQTLPAPAAGVPAAPVHLVDLTGDGLPERLVLDPSGPRVDLNLGGGVWQTRTLDLPPLVGHSLLADDLDGDGHTDLYLLADGPNQALRGDGVGGLELATATLGLADAGLARSAERLDVDGDGDRDLLVHNHGGDALFLAEPGRRGTHFTRDPATPELPAVPRGLDAGDLLAALSGGPLSPELAEADLDLVLTLAPDGRPELHLRTGTGGSRADGYASASHPDPTLTGGTPISAGAPTLPAAWLELLAQRFVDDGLGEVGGDDIPDYSLLGPDVSTATGDVIHLDGDMGLGTTTPGGDLHVVGDPAADGELSVGVLKVSPGVPNFPTLPVGHAELWLTANQEGTGGGVVRWDTTRGQIQLIGATQTEGKGEPLFVVDRGSGHAGVGTDDPLHELQVSGDDDRVTLLLTPGLEGNQQDAELRLAEDAAGDQAMSLVYDGDNNEMRVFGTTDGGVTSTGPHLTIARDEGRVGIQTSTPNASLGVKTIAGSASILRGFDDDDNTVFRVTDGGRLAVGTDAVDAHLHVQGGTNLGSVLVAPADANTGDSQLTLAENAGASFGMRLRYDGGDNQFRVTGINGGVEQGPWLTVLRDSGRVGIQTEDPNASLGVKVIAGSSSIIRGLDDNDETVFRVKDTGRVICSAVEITGGGDLVESFELGHDGTAEPGTVLAIDPANPGRLAICQQAYDRKVAGVVSGAGGVRPGLALGQTGVLEGDHQVALTGRVYVKASAENGPIAPGDLLVSAALPGHAMRGEPGADSAGAVLGKALGGLQDGTGLVLVLVALQ